VPTFGIVAEGITDQVVIENILLGFFDDEDEELVINPVRPLIDRTGRKSVSGWGGWELFFRFFRHGEHLDALQANNYLVLHVDTDHAEDKGYDVPRREGEHVLDERELVARVVAKIEGLIGPDVFARIRYRLIFAIAVNEIECWLLPLLYRNNQAAKSTGCLKAANRALERQGKDPLSRGKDGKEKDYRVYDAVSRAYLKRQTLLEEGRKSPSLAVFIENLEAVGGAGPDGGGAEEPKG
jgi:hypothetical protein